MRKIIALIVLALTFTLTAQAQDHEMTNSKVTTVSLEQTKGEFTQKEVNLKEGAYVFNITNNNAGTDVGFVLIKKGADASNPENHISEAYVTKVVAEGETQSSNTVNLTKGEYNYFCPLNKTPQYTLTVE